MAGIIGNGIIAGAGWILFLMILFVKPEDDRSARAPGDPRNE